MDKYTHINLILLDKKLKYFNNFEIPVNGWINKIRKSLGITFSYIANKLNTSPQVIKKFEQNEVDGSITLNTLKKIADAMECNLVYAFVPKPGSFEKLINNKVNNIVDDISLRVENTMILESQNLSKSDIAKQKSILKNDLFKNNLKNLWKYDA